MTIIERMFNNYAPLRSGEQIIQLPGLPPTWICIYPCKNPKCDCREAFILASDKGPEVLMERFISVLHQASLNGVEITQQPSQAADLLLFILNIDTAAVSLKLNPRKTLDLTDHPQIGPIAKRITGDVLDYIDSLWHCGKGIAVPEQRVLAAKRIVIHGWQPGKLVAWNELCPSARRDVYILGKDKYDAVEQYCPVPDCRCGQVLIDFQITVRNGRPDPGSVRVKSSGDATLQPFNGKAALLKRLWVAFRARHPRYETRFTYRYDIMREAGARFVPHV